MSAESESSPTGRKLNLDGSPRTLGVLLLAIGLIFGLVAFYFRFMTPAGRGQSFPASKAILCLRHVYDLGWRLCRPGPVAIRLNL